MPRVGPARTVAGHRRDVLDRLLDAFGRLVDDQGYDATNLADVAKAASLTRTGIYHYFPDKESLLVAYSRHELDRRFSDLRAGLRDVDDPLDRLDVFVAAHLTYVATHRLPPGPGLRAVVSAEAYDAIARHAEVLRIALAEILREAAHDGTAAADAGDDRTVDLVLGCLTAIDQYGVDDRERRALIVDTQRFLRRAVGAPPLTPPGSSR